MNRLSLTRKIAVFALRHPSVLDAYVKIAKHAPSLPRGYRKIVRK